MAKKREKGRPLSQRARLMIQVCFTALTNGYLTGFVQGKIYTGPLKMACLPGLNCYACPGALGSCPIGALQNSLSAIRGRPSMYVIGFLLAVGSLIGRFVCGFLCPIGLLQDLLHKIPFAKRHKRKSAPGHAKLRWLKFMILAVFVILLPFVARDAIGLGSPWYCKYVCPSGTIMGGWPLIAVNESLRASIGWLFTWKTLLAVTLIGLSLFIYRPFCKYMCPLGAIYGTFNRFALVRFHIDEDKCVRCGACTRVCPMDIDVMNQPNSVECVRCGKCREVCPTQAIELTVGRKTITENGKREKRRVV